jgi:hypothetical protein
MLSEASLGFEALSASIRYFKAVPWRSLILVVGTSTNEHTFHKKAGIYIAPSVDTRLENERPMFL